MTRWLPLVWDRTNRLWSMVGPNEDSGRHTHATRDEAISYARLSCPGLPCEAAEVHIPPDPPEAWIPGDTPVDEY